MNDNHMLQWLVRERRYVLQKPLVFLDRYEELLRPLRDRAVTILELGVFRGDSLRLWAEYLPQARIVGIDNVSVKERGLPTEFPDNVVIHHGQQDDVEFLRHVCAIDAPHGLHLIIDDCSHDPWKTRITFAELIQHVVPGGAYVVEDWCTGPDVRTSWEEDRKQVGGTTRRIVGFVKELVDDLVSAPHFPRSTYIESLQLYPEQLIVVKAGTGYSFKGYESTDQVQYPPVQGYSLPQPWKEANDTTNTGMS